MYESPKCTNYRIFKSSYEPEHYLTDLTNNWSRILTKVRCRNHKLPIEIGYHHNVERILRICTKYNINEVGDEFRYIFNCPF